MKRFSMIDFIVEIAKVCFTPKDISASPHDINFTNHYRLLYSVVDQYRHNTGEELNIGKVIQSKGDKTLLVESMKPADQKKLSFLIQVLNENGIDCVEKQNSLQWIISKNSIGIIDDRKWRN